MTEITNEFKVIKLKEALNLLETKGWTKDYARNSAGEYCASGAISQVLCDDPNQGASVFEEICKEITKTANRISITGWNDDRNVTFSDVKTAFEETIARLEPKPTDRFPVTMYVGVEPSSHAHHQIYWPNGNPMYSWDKTHLTQQGIEFPKPVRVGPNGWTEKETRLVAELPVETVPTSSFRVRTQAQNAGILEARKIVEQWDAEDGS